MNTYCPADRASYRPLTYLACPYSHKDPKVKAERCVFADSATAYLINIKKWNVFSPITHSHPLSLSGLRGDWEFWQKIDVEYLRLSERVVVLQLPGWDTSVGVTAEVEIAKQMGIPIHYLIPFGDKSFSMDVFPFAKYYIPKLDDSPIVTTNSTDSTNPKDLLGACKPALDLVPSALMLRVSQVMKLGARKYGAYNWRTKKVRATVYIAAAMRHLLQLLDGENSDNESGQSHAAHAAACLAILMDAEATGNLIDDRPTPGPANKLIEQLTERKS